MQIWFHCSTKTRRNIMINNYSEIEKAIGKSDPFVQRMIHTIRNGWSHYGDVIMGTIASQITSLTIVYSTVYSGAYQRKHQSSAPLAFVRVIHRGPVNSPHKWPVTRKMFPFDDVIIGTARGASQHMVLSPNEFSWLIILAMETSIIM